MAKIRIDKLLLPPLPHFPSKRYLSKKEYSTILFFNARKTYSSMLSDISKAKRSICLESYIFDPDEVGWKFAKLLAKKANQGVRVQVILDALGSPSHKKLLPEFERLVEYLRLSGVEIHLFNPLYHSIFKYKLKHILTHPLFTLFGRDHRKLLIVDDKGYFGGMNISVSYFSQRDTHLRITGEPVKELQESFNEMLVLTKDFEHRVLHRWGKKLFRKKRNVPKSVHILTNMPAFFAHDIRREYSSLIRKSKKRVWITTPYFVPGLRFIYELRRAAKRGVDVRIILPGKNDFSTVHLASQRYYNELIKSGVRIYRYVKKDVTLLHAKTMTVDSTYSTIGSSNLDYVSLSLSHELNGFFKDRALAKQLDSQFLEDLNHSELIGHFVKKSMWRRLKESLAHGVLGGVLKSRTKLYW